MPQYELMYLLGAQVADDQVPAISEQVQKFIKDFGGTNIVEEQLGKKKLAYPIKKTRNGHYVTVNFTMEAKKVFELDARIHSQTANIIRYLLINLDEHLERMEKDKAIQLKMNRKIPVTEIEGEAKPETAATPKVAAAKPAAPLVEIDEKALDEKIEAALTEDLTK
jgi:small subunit ribosomal protein S6